MTDRGHSERWLVTGSAGQLGQSLLEVAASRGIEVTGFCRANLDITNSAQLDAALDEVAPSVVVNAAAFTKVDLCEEQAEEAHRINARAAGDLARACKGRALLVQVSTEYVFPGSAPLLIPEDAPTEPLSVYGRSKLAGEEAVAESGCEHLIVRTQWLFGAGANFVRTMLRLAASEPLLRVVEDQLGRPTATRALAEGIVEATRVGLRGPLHLACDGICSWYDFAREIVAEGARRGLNPQVPVEPIQTQDMPRPATRPAFAALDLRRARSHGIVLPHWRVALRDYLDAETGTAE
jgi:dTDP-4-dehydrorhamnose reductase